MRGSGRSRTRRVGVLTGVIAVGVAAVAAASTYIVPVYHDREGALVLGQALTQQFPSALTGARFITVPPHGSPVAVVQASHEAIAGFPRYGHNFVILSSGCATLATHANDSPSTSCDDGGRVVRGTRDTTILKLSLRVPANVSCLSFRFRFLSEEYPEFVGSQYNDAFIAELDRSTWSSPTNNPKISAPRDFARTANGHLITINQTGVARVTPGNAKGTTYDAATRVLRASTPVSPRNHSLYLSIFDQGDRQYDSSVFIDQLSLDHRSPCKAGVAPDQS